MRVSIKQLKRIVREAALRENMGDMGGMGGMPPAGGMSDALETACMKIDALEDPINAACDALRDALSALGGGEGSSAAEGLIVDLEEVLESIGDVSYLLSNLAQTGDE